MHADHVYARRRFIGFTPPANPSAATLLATTEAIALAHSCHEKGCLINPMEAVAIALKDSRDKETLFSIARQCAWRHDAQVDDVLYFLAEKFPDYT